MCIPSTDTKQEPVLTSNQNGCRSLHHSSLWVWDWEGATDATEEPHRMPHYLSNGIIEIEL